MRRSSNTRTHAPHHTGLPPVQQGTLTVNISANRTTFWSVRYTHLTHQRPPPPHATFTNSHHTLVWCEPSMTPSSISHITKRNDHQELRQRTAPYATPLTLLRAAGAQRRPSNAQDPDQHPTAKRHAQPRSHPTTTYAFRSNFMWPPTWSASTSNACALLNDKSAVGQSVINLIK